MNDLRERLLRLKEAELNARAWYYDTKNVRFKIFADEMRQNIERSVFQYPEPVGFVNEHYVTFPYSIKYLDHLVDRLEMEIEDMTDPDMIEVTRDIIRSINRLRRNVA